MHAALETMHCLTIRIKSDRLQARIAPGQRRLLMPKIFVNATRRLSIQTSSSACVLSWRCLASLSITQQSSWLLR